MNELQAALSEIRTQLSLCVSPAPGGNAGPSMQDMEGMDHSGMKDMDPSAMAGMHHSQMRKPGAAATVAKPVDPICGMEVDPASAPKTTIDGKTFYFCSKADQERFGKNPSVYVKR